MRHSASLLALSCFVLLTIKVGAQPAGKAGNSSVFAARVGPAKEQLLREAGGSEESERAVAIGLAWLAKQQRPDGHWEFDGEKTQQKAWSVSTGLALLPFLGAGQSHKSGKYKDTVKKGLTFLARSLGANGKFNAGSPQYMYGHAIATLALCEAYGVSRDRALLGPARTAAQFIIATQALDGSWGYQPRTLGDTSILGWQIQALQAARLAKVVDVPEATIKRAVKYLDKVSSGDRKAVYGYREPRGAPGTSLTAIGLLCRYHFDGWDSKNEGMAQGVKGFLGKNSAPKTIEGVKKAALTPDMYRYYYSTLLLRNFGGEEWAEWNLGPKGAGGERLGGMRDWLVLLQESKDADTAGSWAPDKATIGTSCGRLGTTCLCLLTLEVYYRYPPQDTPAIAPK